MKYKIWLCLLLTAVLLPVMGAFAGAGEGVEEEPGQFLVIYPEESDLRTEADSPAGIAQVLFSLGYTADFIESGRIPENLNIYEAVIWCADRRTGRMDPDVLRNYNGKLFFLGSAAGLGDWNLEPVFDSADQSFSRAAYVFEDGAEVEASVPLLYPGRLTDAKGTAGLAETGGFSIPISAWKENVTYIALADYTSDFSRAVLTCEIARQLWPYEVRMHMYTQSLLIDEIYPFTDPDRLLKIVDDLISRKMTFTLCVMPIYEHADYPAMTRFCEVLRYAQANGGSVILHAPIVQNGLDAGKLAEKLTETTLAYLSQNVYPLALAIPSEWMFREDVRGILGRYRTLFLLDNEAFAGHSISEYGLKEFLRLGNQRIMPSLRLDGTGMTHIARYSAFVSMNIAELTDREMNEAIETMSEMPFPMQNLWTMEQAVYMNDGHALIWKDDELTVDGEQRFNVYTPTEPEKDFDYQRNVYYRFVATLAEQNSTLIGFSVAVLILFVILGIRSRRQMHKRFLYRKDSTAGEE